MKSGRRPFIEYSYPKEQPAFMSLRTDRVASVIKNDLGKILLKYQNKNIITVTSVKMTPDLSIARINLSVMDPAGSEQAVYDFLDEKNAEIRAELAGLVRHQLRKVPELEFFRDESAEYASKMEKLFRQARDKTSHQEEDQNENNATG